MSCKITMFFALFSLLLFADWEDDVNQIYRNTNSISTNVTRIDSNIDNYIRPNVTSIKNTIDESLPLFSSFQQTGIGNTGYSAWFSEMVTGIGYHYVNSSELGHIQQDSYGSGYDNMFGLKSATKDDSQFILDYIHNGFYSPNTDEHFSIDSWRNNAYQYADYPTSFLKAKSKGNWINKANLETSYDVGKNQQQYITSHVNDNLEFVKTKVDSIKNRIIGATNNNLYNGVVFTINFGWLKKFIYDASGGNVNVNSLDENTVYGVSLIPSHGDFLYGIWEKWNSMRLYIDMVIGCACYGYIILFVYEKISEILTK